MAESLGKAILELDADAGPLQAALSTMDSQTNGLFSALGTKLSQVMGGNFKAGMVVAGAAVVAGVAVAGAALYKLGEEFDSAYDKIVVATGATGDELEGLKDDFRAVFASVPADADTVATAVGELNQRLGLTGPVLQEIAGQMVELSRLTGTDLSGNIESVSKAFVDWEVPTGKMADTLDGFFAISQDTGISVSDLASSVQKFGSPLRQLGFSLEESAAMFGVFEKAGVNTQTMVPGLKMALANLNSPTDKLADKLEKLGVNAETPAGKLREIFAVLSDKGIPAAERTGLAMEVFGKRAGADMAEAISQGRFELDDMIKVFRNGDGSISKASDETKDLSENWQEFKNRLKVKLEPVATGIFDGVNKGLKFLLDNWPIVEPILIGLALLIAGIGVAAMVAGAQMALAWIIGLGPVAWIVAAMVIAVGLIIANWDRLKSYFSEYWPYIIGTLIGGPLGTLAALIYKNWDDIKAKTESVWNSIKTFLSDRWEDIKSAVSSALTWIGNQISTGWNTVKTKTSSAWNTVKTFVSDRINDVVGFIRGLPGRAASALSSLASAVVGKARSAFDDFKSAISNRIDDAVDAVGKIPGKLKSALGNLDNLLTGAGKAVIQGFLDGINSLLSKVYDTVGKVANKIKSLKGPIDYDRKLLVPEGRAIISGLQAGIDTELTGLYDNVSTIGPSIQAAASVQGAGAGAPSIPGLDRLVNAIDALNQSGTAGAIDALAEAVNERIGNVGVGGRRLTAGDGTIALP